MTNVMTTELSWEKKMSYNPANVQQTLPRTKAFQKK